MVRLIQLASWLPSSTPSITEAAASSGMNTAISGMTWREGWGRGGRAGASGRHTAGVGAALLTLVHRQPMGTGPHPAKLLDAPSPAPALP